MEGFQDIEHFVKSLYAAIKKKIPTKVSQLTNDAGYKTTDTNTTYKLSKSGSTVTLTGSDGSTTSVTDDNTTYSSLKNPYSLDIQNNGNTVASYDGSTAKTANFTNATSSVDGLMSKTDKAKLDGIAAGADVSSIKTVKVNGTALTPDSNKAVNVTVPTLANNATTTTSGMALDARMGKTLADQESQFAKNTAQIESAGTATNGHFVGEYVMISNALYKVTASVAKGDTWAIGTNVATANIGSEIVSLKSDLAKQWEKIYPVGSIYISANSTSPAELFGGTWEQIKDRFLLAAGDAYAAGSTGGEAQHTLTVDEMPSHNHFSNDGWAGYASRASGYRIEIGNAVTYSKMKSGTKPFFDPNSGLDTTLSSTGKNQPHNNMPPYITVYMWQRTA